MIYELTERIELKKFITNRFKRMLIASDEDLDIDQAIIDETNSHKNLSAQEKKYIAKASIKELREFADLLQATRNADTLETELDIEPEEECAT